ncbi:MAG: hypothetical protein SFX73_38460 [Kofleriaceae bacterium]|nr:hypothetical protein [Kofleriaceae bacterium]
MRRRDVLEVYGAALARLGVAAPSDLDAHLVAVASGGSALTHVDEQFATLRGQARALATFAPSHTVVLFE